MAIELNLDDSPEVNITTHKDMVCSVTFTLSDGDSWSANAKIKVGPNYDYPAVKEYTIGSGLTVNGQELIWNFTPEDWNNEEAVYDALLVREPNGQRDFYGRLIVNNAFN
jgi:hypothetical protein